jgi:HAD superfamily hydrolase (TIGR01509 family)
MSLDRTHIRALCFDIDGTLSDTDNVYVQRLLPYLPAALFKDPKHAARRIVMWSEAPANGLMGLADRLGVDDEMAAVLDWIYRHRKHAPEPLLLVPGTKEMLARLKEHYPMAVVSARPASGSMAFLEQFDLTQYFDVIVTGLSAPHTKPYPDPILLAARQMKVLPTQCVMIGDTTVDIRAGKLAGAQTIGVLCGFGEEPELRQLGADLILEETPQVADVLLK